MPTMSRRGVLGILLAPVFHWFSLKGQALVPRPVDPEANDAARTAAPGVRSRSAARVYRADAVILLLGVPIYKRAAVGSGKASIEQAGDGAAARRTLFFAAGSDPTRARGLSRLGWMREDVLGPAAAPSEISYFGVLTSSPEESLEHARKSVGDTTAGRSVFSAVSGRNSIGQTRSAITHFEFDSKAAWSDRELIGKARSTFDGVVNWRETSRPASQNQPAPTFLVEIVKLFGAPSERSSGRYVYNEQEYLLELERHEPARGERLLPVYGKIRNARTRVETRFRVWLEDGPESILPARIEFQPRSFLKLSFTAAPV